MAGQPSPFDPHQGSPASIETVASSNSRGTAILIAVVSLIAFALVGFQLLVIFGFSTMVDPSLPDTQRRQLAAKAFLFGDGPFQIAYVSAFAAITFVSLVSALTHLSNSIFLRPNLRVSKLLSICGGLLLTVVFIGFYLIRSF